MCGPDDRLFSHEDDAAILEWWWPLSQARDVRSALVNRLYCAVSAVFMGVLSTLSVDFLEFLPGNRNHHHLSAMSSNTFAIVILATAKLKMKTLPAGFLVALCSTAI